MILLLIPLLIRNRFFFKILMNKKWILSIVIFYVLLIIFGNKQLSKEAILFISLPIYILLFKHSSLGAFLLKKYLILAVFTYAILLLLIKSFKIISFGLHHYIEQEQWWNQLLYKNLTQELNAHPTYIAMFVTGAIVFLLQQSFESKKYFSRLQYISILTVLFSILFLLVVKISFLAILMIFIGYLFFLIIKNNNFKPVIYGSLLFIAVLLTLNQIPGIKQRVINDLDFSKSHNKNDMAQNRIHERVALWTASLKFIKSHPFSGTSFQGVSSKSVIYPEAKTLYPNLDYPKNCHNNFLEFGVRYGILGTCVFLLFSLLFLREGISRASFEIVGIFILIGFFSITESFMFREQGVSLIAILIAIFGIQLYGKNI